MRFRIITILLLTFSINLIHAKHGVQDIRDIVKVHITEPKRVSEIFDSLRNVKFADEFMLDMAQSEMYCELAMYRLCIEYGNQALASDSVKLNAQYRINQSKTLVNAYCSINDYTKALSLIYSILEQKDKIPSKEGNKLVANMLFTTGTIKHKMGDKKSAYSYFEQSKAMLQTSKIASELALYSYFLGEMTITLIDDSNIEGALKICYERESVIKKIDLLGGAPKGYTDQQRAYLYSKSAYVCMLKNDISQAKKFYKKFLDTDASKRTFEGSFITPYLIKSKQHSEALKYLIPLMKLHQSQDTINLNYRETLSEIEKCYTALENYPTALRYKKIEMDITDSLSLREKISETIQMNMIYETEQRKAFIAIQTAQIENQKLWLIIFGIALLSILSVGTVIGVNIVKRRRRNEKRYRQIMEQEVLRIKGERDAQSDELFKRLEILMYKEKLYANPNLERDDLCRILNTNTTYLMTAIKQNRELTILGYINSIRIDCAKKMLAESDKFDIEQVAVDSGFGSSRTLYRQFKNILELTPLEFFKLSHKLKP